MKPSDTITAMKLRSRKTRWIVVILAILLMAVGVAAFRSDEHKHIEYVEKLGGRVTQKPLLPLGIIPFIPRKMIRFLPMGSVDDIHLGYNKTLTDSNVESVLSCFSNLRSLNLSFSSITDKSMKAVSSHSKLETLNIRQTEITNEGVELLSASRSLTKVYLNGTKISDDSIAHLSQMKQLKYLKISFTTVTDKSVDILCKMPNLVTVDVRETRISEDGKRRLSKINGILN